MANDVTDELLKAADKAVADGHFATREAALSECANYLHWRGERIAELRLTIHEAIEEADELGWLSAADVREALRQHLELKGRSGRKRASS